MSPEKGRIKMMWADASRADAHNLDDLYERWMLKRGQHPYAEGEINLQKINTPSTTQDVDFTDFDFTSPPTVKHARDWMVILLNRVEGINASLSGARVEHQNSFQMNAREYRKTKAVLSAEKAYLLACRRIVKNYIHEWSQMDLRLISEQAEKTGDVPTALLGKSFQIMLNLLLSGIEFSEEDRNLMSVIREYLNTKGMELKQKEKKLSE